MNHLRRALLVLLVLVLHVGCGEEPPTKESPTVEPPPATGSGGGSSLDYVAFGDSLATGYGIADSYVYRYADLVGTDTGTPVNVHNLGVNGLTSEQLRAGIEHDQRAKDAIEQAEVITINIGANDLLRARSEYRTGGCGGADNQDCLRQAVAGFRANWDAILADVTGTQSPDAAIIRTMDFYNPLVDIDEATHSWPNANENDFVVFKKYLEQVDAHIAESSDAYGIPHAEVYQAFNGPDGDEDPSSKGYVAPDRVHPTDGGHDVIARELGKLGYEPPLR